MLLKKNGFRHLRLESLYGKEIALILHKLTQEKLLVSFSVSYCFLSRKAENLKVYLLFAQEKEESLLPVLKKRYLPWVRKQLVRSKKFTRLPKISFLLDQKLKKINEWQKISKNVL